MALAAFTALSIDIVIPVLPMVALAWLTLRGGLLLPALSHWQHPRFFAYFPANSSPPSLLAEMLTATLLDPKISLYQSYLGKAYHQTSRFAEGLSALATAKRLDPRDPTPWLYTAHVLRDRYRPAEALAEISRAIALNDNRAVYRSRLLLDRDLASKNVSLAEFYRQLGFEAWGAFEAQNSLDTDLTNASAHLFLADTYGQLSDRTQALGSELLQYLVHAPVNRNSFNNFNEYTALLEQPGRQVAPIVRWGNDGRLGGVIQTRSGNDRFAHVARCDVEIGLSAELDRDARDLLLGGRAQELHALERGQLLLDELRDLGLDDARPGELRVAAREEAGPDGQRVAVLEVADQGVGIPPDEIEMIFQPFRGSFGKGTGLGLAIVHRIVTDSNGRIDVLSSPGRGTTFLARFPRASGPVAAPTPKGDRPRPAA